MLVTLLVQVEKFEQAFFVKILAEREVAGVRLRVALANAVVQAFAHDAKRAFDVSVVRRETLQTEERTSRNDSHAFVSATCKKLGDFVERRLAGRAFDDQTNSKRFAWLVARMFHAYVHDSAVLVLSLGNERSKLNHLIV